MEVDQLVDYLVWDQEVAGSPDSYRDCHLLYHHIISAVGYSYFNIGLTPYCCRLLPCNALLNFKN